MPDDYAAALGINTSGSGHALSLPLAAAASGHKQRPVFNTSVQKRCNHFLHGSADMRNNPDSGRDKGSPLGLRDHSADKQVHSKLWQSLRPLEGISRHQGLSLPIPFLFFEDVHKQNPARLIENRRNPPLPEWNCDSHAPNPCVLPDGRELPSPENLRPGNQNLRLTAPLIRLACCFLSSGLRPALQPRPLCAVPLFQCINRPSAAGSAFTGRQDACFCTLGALAVGASSTILRAMGSNRSPA